MAVLSPSDLGAPLLAEGRLVQLLPDWRLPPLTIYASTPQRDAQPAKVRHAIAALREWLAAE